MNIEIRNMIKSDIISFNKEFKLQGWEKPISLFERYYEEQEKGCRRVFVAYNENNVLGYATLIPNDENGPFLNKQIPTLRDFNVLEKYQNKGVGTALLDKIEDTVKEYSKSICLGVGLHSGYGSAQRMYIKRGYIPDGSGVWYNNMLLEQNSQCKNDDNLVLYLIKEFI
ncbi:GNAT family N-acetyltransferase [Clostridium perfringens]|uniref:GNAT family N-acetyltransferase n=1 Tax=Clostridium perfringens TaxID=1502 RepID=UPI00224805FD|nr:GNAT family N-acetyltransferase [Clostridium perfringens]MCX0380001.1 GNAT family N-acetyltransferase [Clostridium perfringens]